MGRFIVRWVANALLLLVVAAAIKPAAPGAVDPVSVNGFGAAFLGVALVAIMHLLLKPLEAVLRTAGCLLNVVSLGLLGLVLAFASWWAAFAIVGYFTQPLGQAFAISSPAAAAAAAFWMAVGNALLNMALGKEDDDKRRQKDQR